jgi:hypothetical protein
MTLIIYDLEHSTKSTVDNITSMVFASTCLIKSLLNFCTIASNKDREHVP